MKKLKVVILNTNDEVLLTKKNGIYDIPTFICNNDDNYKKTLASKLKDTYGIKTKEDYFEYRAHNKKGIFYYSYEPNNIQEFKKNKENLVWIDKRDLKDVLLEDKNDYSNLIKMLSKVLKSRFTYSNKDKDSYIKLIKEAKSKDEKEYFQDKMFYAFTNKDMNKLDAKYRKKFAFLLANDINLIKILKQNEYINSIKNQNLFDLTYEEALLIGKKDVWYKAWQEAYELFSSIPSILRNNLFLIEKETKLSSKNYLTPNVLYKSYLRYKNATVEEIKKDLKERENKMNKNKIIKK